MASLPNRFYRWIRHPSALSLAGEERTVSGFAHLRPAACARALERPWRAPAAWPRQAPNSLGVNGFGSGAPSRSSAIRGSLPELLDIRKYSVVFKSYLWFLGLEKQDATEVEIRFVARGDAATRIEIEHHGWDRLGDSAQAWRERNRIGWQTLMPHFLSALEQGDSS